MNEKNEQPSSSVGCVECERLRGENLRLAAERQMLLEQLANERERNNALFIGYPPQERFNPASATHSVAELPLRYQVVDAINNKVKSSAPSVQHLGKKLIAVLRGANGRG